MNETYYRVCIITRREKEEKLKEVLYQAGVRGMTITQAEGCGVQEGIMNYVQNGRNEVMLIPKIIIDIIVFEKEMVQTIIDTAVLVCRTGLMGDGKIFVEKCNGKIIRIRTDEENRDALKE